MLPEVKNFDREQLTTILLIAGVLFGLLGLPIIVQSLYGIDAVKTAFGVIVVYALINWYMKNQRQSN